MNHAEHNEQAALFHWAELMTRKHPGLDLMYAIPNAARRSLRQGAWMKAEGMKAGVPDVHLPVANREHIGLWIEMKAGKNRPTPEQRARMAALEEQGHLCVVCYCWRDAAAVIELYLSKRG